MSSYLFGPLYPQGVRLDWEPGERVRVVYRDLGGRQRRRVAKIRRIDGTNALLEFHNQFILVWHRLEHLRKERAL